MALRPLAGALALVFALGCAGSARAAAPYLPPDGRLYAGVTNSISEPGALAAFDARAGKHAAVLQTFISWGYTGSHLYDAGARRARAMLHLSTKDSAGREAITPRAIARGRGDRYLVALGRALAAGGQVTYLRLMAEMNGSWNPYSAYGPGGYRGGAHSTRYFRQAWRRIVLILRGGPVQAIDARLGRLGMTPVRGEAGGELARPRLAVLWVPEVWGDPNVPGNAARAYWPGARYVDWVGTDFYSKFPNYRGLDAFYAAFPAKPFCFGEWALWGRDDPGFVRGLFGWIHRHRRVRLVVYNQGSHPAESPFWLARYPRAAAALRAALRSPLFAPLAPEFS